MIKVLKIKGCSGLIDLLAVLEYGLEVVTYVENIILSVEWVHWLESFDALITINKNINYINYKQLPKIDNFFKVHATDKTITSDTPLSYYANLFKKYDLIEIWDNRTIAKNYPTTEIFNKISFKKEIYKEFENLRQKLGDKYIAFHGRFTDFPYAKSQEELFKQQILHVLNNTECNVVLCTDNQKIISEFLNISRVYNFSYIKELLLKNIILPELQPTHALPANNNIDLYQMQKSAILDLLLCVNSEEFYQTNGGYSSTITNLRKKSNLKNYKIANNSIYTINN